MVVAVGQGTQVDEYNEEQSNHNMNGMQQNEGERGVLDPSCDINAVLSDERLQSVCLNTHECGSCGQCTNQTTPKLPLAFQFDER